MAVVGSNCCNTTTNCIIPAIRYLCILRRLQIEDLAHHIPLYFDTSFSSPPTCLAAPEAIKWKHEMNESFSLLQFLLSFFLLALQIFFLPFPIHPAWYTICIKRLPSGELKHPAAKVEIRVETKREKKRNSFLAILFFSPAPYFTFSNPLSQIWRNYRNIKGRKTYGGNG